MRKLNPGTLTTNQMSVARFMTCSSTSSFAEYQVGGTTFAPIGSITTMSGKHAGKTEVRNAAVNKLVEIAAICNDAKIAYNSVSQGRCIANNRKPIPIPISENLPRLP